MKQIEITDRIILPKSDTNRLIITSSTGMEGCPYGNISSQVSLYIMGKNYHARQVISQYHMCEQLTKCIASTIRRQLAEHILNNFDIESIVDQQLTRIMRELQ